MISLYSGVANAPGWHYTEGFYTFSHYTTLQLAHVICKYVWSPVVFFGGRRKQDCFVKSYVCALDFDSPEYDIQKADAVFGAYKRIIATTKSHQLDKNGVVCDRFRVILFFEKPIDALDRYRYNMKQMANKHPCDRKATDGARFFYPCKSIVSVKSGKLLPVKSESPTYVKQRQYASSALLKKNKRLPVSCQRFLEFGDVSQFEGRNVACFVTACFLFDMGTMEGEVIQRLQSSPFDRQGFSESELISCVTSAKQRSRQR